MKTLNELIHHYSVLLQQGEIQAAYKGVLDFIGKLRADVVKKYPNYDVSSIYQGYMDMSYFALSTASLKEKGLKIAIVYQHEKGDFEAWLSARNREISKKFESAVSSILSENANTFHDPNNQDAFVECILVSAPDFEEQAVLMKDIEQGVEQFMNTVTRLLSGRV